MSSWPEVGAASRAAPVRLGSPDLRVLSASLRLRLALLLSCGLLQPLLAGMPAQRLTNDGRLKRDPVFADSSGQTIVFVVQERPEQLRLMRLHVSDGRVEPLHTDQTKSEFEPTFSRDGRLLAFVQSRGNLSLALVIRNLAASSEAEVKPGGGFSGVSGPTIAPGGERIYYSYPEDGRQQIFSVDPQAGDRRTVIDSPGINNWPSLSPDGRSLVFSSTRDGNYEIYTANTNGADVRRLTNHPRQDIRPRYAPDGRRLAFISNRDGNYEAYTMQADGSGLARLTDHPERDDFPAWHPDGRRLLLVCERDGQHDLYLLDVP